VDQNKLVENMKKRALSIITTFLIIFTLIAPIPLSHTALTAAHYPGGIPTGIDQFKLLSNGPGAGDSGSVHEEGEPSVFHVVLVTGDVVTVTQYPSGRRSFAVQGAEPKEGFAIFTIRNETYIVPEDANLKRLDLGLFDIDYLVREEYYKLDFTPLLVSLSSQDAVSTLTNDPGIKGFVSRAFRSVPAVAAKAKFADVKSLYTALMEKPDVAKVWLDAKVHVALYESLPIIGLTNPANLVWSAGITGEYMKIAIIDTGIDPSHPDVGPRIFAAQDFTDDGTIDDLYGHGTHVAAIAAGNAAASTSPVDPNGKFKGVAYQASLINAKVVGSNGYGYSSWAIAGIEWAVSQGADVINLSLQYGTTDGNDPVAQAVNAAVDSGVVACVAAGNFGWRYFTVTTPGSASKALTVGATDKWDQLAWFSSRGPVTGGEIRLKPDVVAPGVNVYSAHATNAPSGEAMPNPPGQPQSGPPNYPPYYTWGWSGTSMATPHVTGLSALVLQSHPGWQPWQVKDAIMNTAVPLDGYNVYEEGTGRVVAPAAVFTNVLLDESTYTFGMITDSLATPSHQYRVINYGAAAITVDLSVTLNDAGTGADWTWTHASTSVPTLWNIPGGGTSAIFNLNLDMAGLPPGMYSGMLVATVQGTGQQLRSACGFARMDTLTVTKLDMEGNPAPGWLVWKWKLNPSSELDYWLNEWQTWTDNNGQAVFYHTDGNYELVTATWSDPPIFTIADNLAVSGNMATTLDERTTNKVDFDPNKSGQIIAATNTQLYYPYTITLPGVTMSGWWGFGIMWSYPGSTESWISMVSSNWKATFGYSYYPSSDFDLTDWGTVNTSEWHDLLYASNGVPGPMHFVADYSSLVQKWSVYPVNLGPPVGASRWTFTYARLFDDPSTGFVPWWYGASAFGWKISLPQARMEYLSPDVWYDQDLEKVWDIPWQWTSGWFWHGPYRALSAGDQWTEIWNTGFSNKLYAWVDTSTNDFEVWGHAIMDGYFHNYHDYGRWPAGTLEVTGPGGLLFSGSIDDAFDVWFGVQPLGPYTTTIDATATQQLSTRMTAVYTFDTSVADSILPDGTVEVPQIAFGPWGLNLENTGRGGEVTVGIFANSFTGTKMNSVEAWYSTDDGGAWNPLALSETPWTNYYEGQLPDLSGKYVSLKATAMNALGNSVTQTCIRAFYVKAAEPVPFTSYLVRNPVTLDGRMTTPDEWSDTIPRDLTFGAGSSLKKVPAELWIKNDGTWLYVMERVRSPGGAPGRDNWDSGSIGYYWDSWGPPSHRWQHSDLGGVNFDGSTFDLYGWDEVQWYDDTSATPGQNNVQGAATYDGTYYWFEFRKPLKSGDGYDWTFEPGATYGPMPPDLQVGFWDDSEATFYGTHILLHLSGPGGAGLAGVSQG